MQKPVVMLAGLLLVCSPALSATIEPLVIDSAPPEYSSFRASAIEPGFMSASKTLSGVPAAMWWYGCSATSAGMLFGYYDNHGYENMFAGTLSGNIDTAAERNLIATSSHISDYWVSYGSTSADPWESGGSEHTWATCTADFMGTNQLKWDYKPAIGSPDGTKDTNYDGSTTFFNYTDNQPLYDPHISALVGVNMGTPDISGCSGLRLFAESRGYTIAYEGGNYQNYNQNIYGLGGVAAGFSYDQFKAEIDAGRPVLISLASVSEGHTVLGFGYNDDAADTVILYDTWDYAPHNMTWGGSYGGMDHKSVTVMKLDPANNIPEPGTLGLFGLGILAAGMWMRRRKAA